MTGPQLGGFEAERVTPEDVIQGIAPSAFDDVLCGITYAWLNLNSAFMLQAELGAGKVLLTTLRFQYGEDPYATLLLDSMVRYVSSDQCRPRLKLGSAVPVQ